jgi:hypothetical protein
VFGRKPDLRPAHPVALVKDPAGTPAVNLTKVREAGHLDLAKAADKAGVALSKRDLAGIRAQAVLLLDHSGSMRSDYARGAVQQLVQRVLGFALQIDVDGTVPVIRFDSRVWPSVDVTVDNHKDVVANQLWRPNSMGTTDLAGALAAVRGLAEETTAPLYVAVVTDGEPDSPRDATEQVCDLARYPVFLKFLALQPVRYLSGLDTLDASKRLLDNVNAQPPKDSRLRLLDCTDLEFQEAMVEEWDAWVRAAKGKGVLL